MVYEPARVPRSLMWLAPKCLGAGVSVFAPAADQEWEPGGPSGVGHLMDHSTFRILQIWLVRLLERSNDADYGGWGSETGGGRSGGRTSPEESTGTRTQSEPPCSARSPLRLLACLI